MGRTLRVVEKVLENSNYVVRRINTNKCQILHRIRLRKFTPRNPIIEEKSNDTLEEDDEIPVQHDDLQAITWETDFGDCPFRDVKENETFLQTMK